MTLKLIDTSKINIFFNEQNPGNQKEETIHFWKRLLILLFLCTYTMIHLIVSP